MLLLVIQFRVPISRQTVLSAYKSQLTSLSPKRRPKDPEPATQPTWKPDTTKMLFESFSSLKGLSPSQYIFGIQAIPLVASGVFTLFWPSAAAALPNSPLKDIGDGTIQAIRYGLPVPGFLLLLFSHRLRLTPWPCSLTSLSLGSFYTIASYQNNIPMMIASVPGRLLAAFVFYRAGGGWRDVAPFEGVMGLLTAVGIYLYWAADRSESAREVKEE